MNKLSSICVFCGANAGKHPAYVEAARQLGEDLGQRQLGLVYGGGSVGLMGIIAQAALDSGCRVVGVIPEPLTTREVMGREIGEMIVVESMHERKATMAYLADAFVAMPGGFGTLDELFEAITWGQLGIHRKPIGLLNVAGYYDPLLVLIERAVDEGFIRGQHRQLLVVDHDPTALLDKLESYEPPPALVAWLDLGQA